MCKREVFETDLPDFKNPSHGERTAWLDFDEVSGAHFSRNTPGNPDCYEVAQLPIKRTFSLQYDGDLVSEPAQ
jgi:hypothetical protein